jgi:hypothetical protein
LNGAMPGSMKSIIVPLMVPLGDRFCDLTFASACK